MGKVEVGYKKGLDSVLTKPEEQCLISYALHMAEIRYGCSQDQQ